MRTRYCAFANCSDAVRVQGEYCQRHRTPAQRHELPAPGEASTAPDPELLRCKDPDCAEVVQARFGPYCYCRKHRDQRGIPTGAGGHKAGTVGGVAGDDTHEGRLRDVLKAARALDRAERRAKVAGEELRRARKLHRDALIAATAPPGVQHTE